MAKLQEKEISEIAEIQNYLASFNKEIECDDVEGAESENENTEESDAECENSQVLYAYESADEPGTRKKAAEIIRLGSKKESSSVDEIAYSQASPLVKELNIDDRRTIEMVAQFAEQAAKVTQGKDAINSLGAYQTVTVVPSDTNPGELSYVLFVSDPSDCIPKDGDDMNVTVFNINGNEHFGDAFLTNQVATDRVKMRTIRLARRNIFVPQQYVCNFCSYTSSKRYLLSRHMKSHSDERPHKCGVCERGFKTVASLQNHVNTHTGTRPHPCKECDSCFTTSGELVRHVRYKHTHEKPHKCTECDYASVELSKLKRHMRCHTGERPYQCPHCTYASPDTYKLKRHLRIHTGEKPYECDICQTRFTQSNSLKAHRLIHTGNKPVFHCEYCPATCGRKTDLRIHMEKLHSSDKPHRCNRCGKVFLDRYSYKIHIKSHDGEKCFKCDLCDYASISQRHLETHMFVHTDQKPFRCDECDQCFRQKQLLKRHRNIYHDPNYVRPEPKVKPHVCVLCSKAFRHRGNLIRHFAIHDPEATAIEREAAMNIEEPKVSGEEQDAEENEYPQKTDDNDQQVVVFEVIQLPSANISADDETSVTMVDGHTLFLNGNDVQSYSIIEQVDDNDVNIFPFNESIPDPEDVENISSVSTGNLNSKARSSFRIKLGNSANVQNDSDDANDSAENSNRQYKRNPNRKPRLLKLVADKSNKNEEHASTNNSPCETTSVKREKEIDVKKSQVQKDMKDIEACFGFDVKGDDDNADDLLSMPPSANYQVFQSHLVQDIS